MKNSVKRFSAIIFAILMILPLALSAFASDSADEVTVLFTHDLHSHFLPYTDENGNEIGGYARLMSVIKAQKEKYPDAILVDGGDFSMGSLFQTAYTTSALELRLMGAMGYDVTTLGNHEFDYLPEGLIAMLDAAVMSGDSLPEIVNTNYLPPKKGETGYSEEVWASFDGYGIKEYTVIERGDLQYVVFGIFGEDSHACAPNSGMIFADPIASAQITVDKAKKECFDKYGKYPVVICLSHSGTEDGKGEDYNLAKNVNGIDVIVSAHTHTTLSEPINVNGTYIVSAGNYGDYLGVVRLKNSKNGYVITDYELIAVDDTVEEDKNIAALIESYKKAVEKNYLSSYGVSFDQVLVNNPYEFESTSDIKSTSHETPVCNIFSDSYKWAVEKATGKNVDVALTAAGVVRESLPTGDITVSDVFNAASLGVGTEGELIKVYVTGKDLMNALEVDASVQPLMSSAQLYFSGVEYSFNTNRMIFNKVDYAMLRRDDGSLEKIDPEKMYSVVTGMYAGQMLGSVESTSMGLLTITPRDEKGNPITPDKLVNFVVKDENDIPVKEWFAISSYLMEMGGEMDAKYADVDGRKVVYSSLNPADLLRNANKFTYILIVVIIVLIAAIVLITIAIVRKAKKSKLKRAEAKAAKKAAEAKAALANAIEEEYNTTPVTDEDDETKENASPAKTTKTDDNSDGFDY